MTAEDSTKTFTACPYLEINENEVFCRATDWGKNIDPQSGEVKIHYGSLPSSYIPLCESPTHLRCSTYKKEKAWEGEQC